MDSEVFRIGARMGLTSTSSTHCVDFTAFKGSTRVAVTLAHQIDDRGNAFDFVRDADLAVDAGQRILDRHAHGVRTAGNDERIVGKLREGDGSCAALRAALPARGAIRNSCSSSSGCRSTRGRGGALYTSAQSTRPTLSHSRM